MCREKTAAYMIRTIVKVVAHCHSLGVIHRCGQMRLASQCPLPRLNSLDAADSHNSLLLFVWMLMSGVQTG